MSAKRPAVDWHDVGNKQKRQEMYRREKEAKQKAKREAREQAAKLREQLGDAAPPKAKPQTLETKREADDTVVASDDEEVMADEDMDEFATYYSGKQPKILITTSRDPSRRTMRFVAELLDVLPNSSAYGRQKFTIKQICQFGAKRDFTDAIFVFEHREKPADIVITHLPEGPTAHFKLTSLRLHKEIWNKAKVTDHRPELILNRFTTRLGMKVSRMLTALFPHDPQFVGRRVCTFHNQRDFIFFRHHRYVFEEGKRVRLQEIGPRFTIKLMSLQRGIFEPKFAEYEWKWKPEVEASRTRFVL